MIYQALARQTEKFAKNQPKKLDVAATHLYNSRHPDTGRFERTGESQAPRIAKVTQVAGRCKTQAAIPDPAGRGNFQQRLSAMPRVRRKAAFTGRPSGRGIGEAKEREGKGRDACRDSCEDGFLRESRAGCTVLMNRKIHWSSNFLI